LLPKTINEKTTLPQSDIITPPLNPYIVSRFISFFHKSDKIVALSSAVFYLLSVPLFFFLCMRLFDKRIALYSLALYITNPVLLSYSISGLSVSLLIFLFLILILLLYKIPDRYFVRVAAIGIILGLCYLTRYSYGLLYAPLLFYIYMSIDAKKDKVKACVLFTVFFLITTCPWLIRNSVLTGNPFYTLEFLKPLMFTTTFPENYLLCSTSPIDISFFQFISLIIKKFYYGIYINYNNLLYLPQNYLMPFFIMYFFAKQENLKLLSFKKIVLVLFLTITLILSLYYPGINILIPFIPIVIVYAVFYFITYIINGHFTRNLSKRIRQLLLLAFIIVNMYPLMTSLVHGGATISPYPVNRMNGIEQLTDADKVIISDIPWAIAWYSNRKSVWIPYNRDDYNKIKSSVGPIQCIYLSPLLRSFPAGENISVWLNAQFHKYLPWDIDLNKGKSMDFGGVIISDKQLWEKLEDNNDIE